MPSQRGQQRGLLDVSERGDTTDDKRVFEGGASGGSCEPQRKEEEEEVEEVDVEMEEEEEEAPEPHQVQQYDHSPSRTIILFVYQYADCTYMPIFQYLLVNAH